MLSGGLGQDLASGLVGPLVVCRKGTLDKARRRTDVDKEFALLFMVFDENDSWYLEKNIATYMHKNPDTYDKDDEEFMESNMMHGRSSLSVHPFDYVKPICKALGIFFCLAAVMWFGLNPMSVKSFCLKPVYTFYI